MATPRPPLRGRRRGRQPIPGGRRAGDPRPKRARVAVLPEEARIDVGQAREVSYWAEQFGVTAGEIREAVKSAGPRLKDVRKRLAKHRSY